MWSEPFSMEIATYFFNPSLIRLQYNECTIKKTSGSLILKATILISQHKAIAAILQFLPTIFAERAPSKAPTERPVVNLNFFSSNAVLALYVNITTLYLTMPKFSPST